MLDVWEGVGMVLMQCGWHCRASFCAHVRFAAAIRVVEGGECFGTSRFQEGVSNVKFLLKWSLRLGLVHVDGRGCAWSGTAP